MCKEMTCYLHVIRPGCSCLQTNPSQARQQLSHLHWNLYADSCTYFCSLQPLRILSTSRTGHLAFEIQFASFWSTLRMWVQWRKDSSVISVIQCFLAYNQTRGVIYGCRIMHLHWMNAIHVNCTLTIPLVIVADIIIHLQLLLVNDCHYMCTQ